MPRFNPRAGPKARTTCVLDLLGSNLLVSIHVQARRPARPSGSAWRQHWSRFQSTCRPEGPHDRESLMDCIAHGQVSIHVQARRPARRRPHNSRTSINSFNPRAGPKARTTEAGGGEPWIGTFQSTCRPEGPHDALPDEGRIVVVVSIHVQARRPARLRALCSQVKGFKVSIHVQARRPARPTPKDGKTSTFQVSIHVQARRPARRAVPNLSHTPRRFNPRAGPKARTTGNHLRQPALLPVSIHVQARRPARPGCWGSCLTPCEFQSTCRPEGPHDDVHIEVKAPSWFQSTCRPEGPHDHRAGRHARALGHVSIHVQARRPARHEDLPLHNCPARFQSTCRPEGPHDQEVGEVRPMDLVSIHVQARRPARPQDGIGLQQDHGVSIHVQARRPARQYFKEFWGDFESFQSTCRPEGPHDSPSRKYCIRCHWMHPSAGAYSFWQFHHENHTVANSHFFIFQGTMGSREGARNWAFA